MAAVVYLRNDAKEDWYSTTLPQGASLVEASIEHNLSLDTPCGGNGLCGKCRIRILAGEVSPPSSEERNFLSPAELAEGIRLACKCYPAGSSEVRFQPERKKSDEVFDVNVSLSPAAEKRFSEAPVMLNSGTLENQLSLTDQSEHSVPLDEQFFLPGSLKKLSLQAHGSDAVRCLLDRGEALQPLSAEEVPYGCAVDLGTTTLAVFLVNLLESSVEGYAAELNAQKSFGADVISRAHFASSRRDGLASLQEAVLGQIERMAGSLITEHEIPQDWLKEITVAGNTIMLHLLIGTDPRGITVSPFIPVFTGPLNFSARELGLETFSSARIRVLGSISGYIGSDITSGIQAVSLLECEPPSLFIDIGTNGEIVLWDGKRLYCCSSAAGPAFEGASILHGTGGVPGAISSVAYHSDANRLICRTVSGSAPAGICASGIIDAVSAALEIGILDSTGALSASNERAAAFLSDGDEGRVFLLSEEGDHPVCLTQKDIREIQLAKAAVSAGIRTLLHSSGISPRHITQTVLAGGFGSRIHTPSALRIGLLPSDIGGEITAGGNTAGKGAVLALTDAGAIDGIEEIRKRAAYIELSASKEFQQFFLEEMVFPGEEEL